MTRARALAARAEAVVQALLTGDVLALQDLVSPDVIDHSAQADQPAGWPGVRERAMTICAAFPEGDLTVEVLSSEGDVVLARVEVTAVRRPTALDAPPAANRLTAVLVLRLSGGLLTEMWTSADLVLDLPRQQLAPARTG